MELFKFELFYVLPTKNCELGKKQVEKMLARFLAYIFKYLFFDELPGLLHQYKHVLI